MIQIAIDIWGIGILAIVTAYSWALWQFTSNLRDRHMTMWRLLGRPAIFWLPPDSQAMFSFIGYIASGEYRKLSDPMISRYGATCRYSIVALFVWFAIFIAFLNYFGQSA